MPSVKNYPKNGQPEAILHNGALHHQELYSYKPLSTHAFILTCFLFYVQHAKTGSDIKLTSTRTPSHFTPITIHVYTAIVKKKAP